jgi:hypothetical protein
LVHGFEQIGGRIFEPLMAVFLRYFGLRNTHGPFPAREVILSKIPNAVVLALLLGVCSTGCQPRAVNRTLQVVSDDAGPGPTPPIYPPGAGGSGGSGGAGGGPTPDGARPDVRASGDGRARDTATDLGPEETINALLALTPAACAMKLTRDYPLVVGGGDADAGTAGTAAICGLKGAVYWVADMQVSCDGRNTPGKCDIDHDNDTFAHARGGAALASAITPFVVVPAGTNINGLRAGTVVAVINQLTRQMVFAVFGDTSATSIGAASYACAEKVGINPDPTTGGQKGNTVVYIAFTGNNAVPADIENQTQAAQLGQTLAAKLITDNR